MDTLQKQLVEKLESITPIRPGDKLVLRINADLTQAQAEEIKGVVKGSLGDDLQFLIIDRRIDPFVMRAEDAL